MVFLKNISIILALFAIVKSLPSKSLNKKVENPLREEIIELLANLDEDGLNVLSHRTDNILDRVLEFFENAVEIKGDWLNDVRPEVDALTILINETHQSANEQGVDITSCIDGVTASVQPILIETSNLVYESMTQFQDKYLDKWRDISEQITHTYRDLYHYLMEVWNCDNDECLKDILKSIQDKLQPYIEGELTQLVYETLDAMKPEGEKILTDGDQLIDKCIEVLPQARDDFIECAKELMS